MKWVETFCKLLRKTLFSFSTPKLSVQNICPAVNHKNQLCNYWPIFVIYGWTYILHKLVRSRKWNQGLLQEFAKSFNPLHPLTYDFQLNANRTPVYAENEDCYLHTSAMGRPSTSRVCFYFGIRPNFFREKMKCQINIWIIKLLSTLGETKIYEAAPILSVDFFMHFLRYFIQTIISKKFEILFSSLKKMSIHL